MCLDSGPISHALPVTEGHECPSFHDAFRTVPDKVACFSESFVHTVLMSLGVNDSLSLYHSLLHDSSETDGVQTELGRVKVMSQSLAIFAPNISGLCPTEPSFCPAWLSSYPFGS